MQGSNIPEKEYLVIIDKLNRYCKLKRAFKKFRSQLTDFEREGVMENGCKKGVDELIESISNNSM